LTQQLQELVSVVILLPEPSWQMQASQLLREPEPEPEPELEPEPEPEPESESEQPHERAY
jgi:hypothetical protein